MSFTTSVAKGSSRHAVSTPAAWAADYDLMAFAESLDIKSFTALSQGLGLGELRPVGKKETRGMPVMREPDLPIATPMPLQQTRANIVDKAQLAHVGAEARSPIGGVAETAPAPRAISRRLSFERRLMAWSVDFLFVTSSLAMALSVVTAIAAARAAADTSILELRPVTWLAAFSPLQILGGVYAIYLVYNLTFKFAVGRTFGESLMGLAHKAKRVASAAS